MVKLYTWNGRVGNVSLLQCGLVGNVTLYNLYVNVVSAMLEGQLLPHPAIQLALVLVVTFISSKKLPKSWLKTMF